MKEETPQHNNEEEKYTVEHHPTDKDGITEDIFINKKTGLVEKRVWVLPDKRRAKAILNPKTGEVKEFFKYDENGSIVEFIDKKALDNINHERAVMMLNAAEKERDDLLTKLMFENFALGDEIKKEFGKGMGRQFGQEEEKGN